MRELNPYVFYNGDCQAAVEFYSQTLDTPIDALMRYGDAPDGSPFGDDYADKVMHASLRIGASTLMASDAPPGNYQKPQGVSICLQAESAQEAEDLYAALSAGGEIQMPLEKTFWAERFGAFTDRYGIKWMVNCDFPT
ncbi:VOC family protein [Gilvimarinus agarilyticus]|uniref:VOC family protein n=1 Tax=unclassified Gilvimarinus TaxID=2642066 RepID=UPI001C0897DA|nr:MULTISPECIES: VOC family protein [unclassified Gilvimarinus]MBU2887539.1 VOC family protein [Gilvimarinus agarilyticus]MDO6572190.1 VOC family protein [Gilvimarinus sp. 2_MG-2023]MDO6746754.1 VOC family protein [Gilvimarinus sp. 1_MG-2023]